MARDRSFASKTAKGLAKGVRLCPTCGEAISNVKLVTSGRSEVSGNIRFQARFVSVCKCNEKEVLG